MFSVKQQRITDENYNFGNHRKYLQKIRFYHLFRWTYYYTTPDVHSNRYISNHILLTTVGQTFSDSLLICTGNNFRPVTYLQNVMQLAEWNVTNKTQKPFSFRKYWRKEYLEERLTTIIQVHNQNLNNSRNANLHNSSENFLVFFPFNSITRLFFGNLTQIINSASGKVRRWVTITWLRHQWIQ